MFLPTTKKEMDALGWDAPDVIIVTGDTYIDSPYIGAALIGKVLMAAGYKTAIIAQPEVDSGVDIIRLGEPRLFWGVTGGSIDSMVANYTAAKKFRKSDDLTPGGINNRRPDRAVMRYCNLIRQHFKNSVPIIIGGIEASLRRVSHYDYNDNKIRNSILPDAKADILVYGMGEETIIRLASHLKKGEEWHGTRGICYMASEPVPDYLPLPSAEAVKNDTRLFEELFKTFYNNCDPLTARGLVQPHGNRYLIQNPPALYETTEQLDHIFGLSFQRDAHPYYKAGGVIKALDTIRHSITTHRGCYGECNFCAIAVHQGRTVRSRSEASILREGEAIASLPGFKGYIQDAGGATANMYGQECSKKCTSGACDHRRCLYPTPCPKLPLNHGLQLNLLKKLRALPGIKKVFVSSGIRHDMILADGKQGEIYLEEILKHHTSGQLKIAPEHGEEKVLKLMGKPGKKLLFAFKKLFDRLNGDRKQFLTYYFVAAHPGCTEQDMEALKTLVRETLKMNPEQVQIFTPTPSTYSTLMYYTGRNPFTGETLFVEKEIRRKERQKERITGRA